jgi:protoporphyrinogen oxidase
MTVAIKKNEGDVVKRPLFSKEGLRRETKMRIAVVGGGISGLAAAYFALRKGHDVEIFERDDQWGGLASDFDLGGTRIERYYHFICGGDARLIALAEELGLASKLVFRPSTTSTFIRGRLYPFSTATDLLRFKPIPPLARLRFGLNIMVSKRRRAWEPLDKIPAREWLLRRVGREAYEAVWDPLLRIKFGPYFERVSAAWIWHRIHRVGTSRRGLFSREMIGYFQGGTPALIAKLVEAVVAGGGRPHHRTAVKNIRKNSDGSWKLDTPAAPAAGFDKIVLALPLPVAAGLLAAHSPEFAEELGRIPFLAITCGVFRLKRKVTDAFWLNINDPGIPSSGFIEYTNLNPLPEIAPDHILYVPFYLPPDDPIFRLDVAGLRDALFPMVRAVIPGLDAADIVDFRMFKDLYAQAVCLTGFSRQVPPQAGPVRDVFLLDSTQLYPADRNLSGLIANAERLAGAYF